MPPHARSSPITWLLVILALPFAAGAAALLASALRAWRGGDPGSAAGPAIGGALLAVIAALLLAAALAARRAAGHQKEIEQLRAAHPDRPWLWRPEWAAGRLEHHGEIWGFALLWSFALMWMAASCGALWLVVRTHGWGGEVGGVVMSGVFIAAGFFLVAMATQATLRHRRFGRSSFVLSSLPAPLGGRLAGTLLPPPAVPAGTELRVAVECLRRRHTSERSSSSHRLWVDGRRALATGGELPVALDVPFDCEPTTPESEGERSSIVWYLTVSASLPGVDYEARFEVPVFTTPDSNPARRRDTLLAAAGDRAAGPPEGSRVRIVQAPNGTTLIRLPAPGWVPWWCGLTVLPLLAAWPIARLAATTEGAALGVYGWALGISVAAGAITLLGLVMQPSRVLVGPEHLGVRRGWRPLAWTREIPRARIVGSRHDPGAAHGSRASVEVLGDGGRSWTVALGIRDPEEAAWLAAELRRRLGVGTGSQATPP